MANTFRSIRVLLTGGGSGGHVTPLLAIADAIRKLEPEARFRFVGVRQGLEATIVPRAAIPIHFAPSIGMPTSRSPLAFLRFLLTLLFGVGKAMLILLWVRPDCIVASGGFSSAPTVFASALWNMLTFGLWHIPIYMHEQNAIPGRMNRFAGRFATRIGISHPAASAGFAHRPTELVGYPVRSGFQSVDRAEARKQLGIPDEDIYLVVTGGSQGSRTINRSLIDALPFLAKRTDLRIMHSCGTMQGKGYSALEDTKKRLAELTEKPEHYEVTDYLHDLPLHLAAADIALIRAGAGSLVEVCSRGLPALVIPKANLPGDSQVANARELAARGAIEILYEEPSLQEGHLIEVVPGDYLAQRLFELIDQPEKRAALARNALNAVDPESAHHIAERVLRLARGLSSLNMAPSEENRVEIAPVPAILVHSPSPSQLRKIVERQTGVRFERAIDHGRVRDNQLAAIEDLDYVRYRGAALLVHPLWQLRNEGVKLIGLTRHEQRLDLLLHLISDRTPAPALHRLLGGDFREVGFVRRNALASLALIGHFDRPVVDAVTCALQDPYYEVRATALRLVRRMVREETPIPVEMTSTIRDCCRDKSLEVRWEALHTFGHVGDPGEVLKISHEYSFAPQPPVREAVLKAWHALLDRFPDMASNDWHDRLSGEMDRFAITSIAFHPYFPLKERFATLRKRLEQREAE